MPYNYKSDVNGHALKVGDIVRIIQSTKTTQGYKKFDWVVTSLYESYSAKIKPHNYKLTKLPDGKPSDVEQTWDNHRLQWKLTPPVAAEPVPATDVFVGKSKKFKVGDNVTLTDTASWDKDYEGLKCEVLPAASLADTNLYLKPLMPRPNETDEKYKWMSFWMDEQHVVLTKDYVAPSIVEAAGPFKVGDLVKNAIFGTGEVLEVSTTKKSNHTVRVKFAELTDWFNPAGLKLAGAPVPETTKFKVGDIVVLDAKDVASFVKKYGGLPCRVEKLAEPAGTFKDQLFLKPLRDRPNVEKGQERDQFWWKTTEVKSFDVDKDFIVGDRVKILEAGSSFHPNGSVGTLTKLDLGEAWVYHTIEFASGKWPHTHSPAQLELTDAPLTVDYSIEPYIEPKPKSELKFEVGAKVKILSNPSEEHPVGSIGTIEKKLIGGYSDWEVGFESDSVKHWHTTSELELVTDDVKVKPVPKVGDYVKILKDGSITYPVGSVGKVLNIEGSTYGVGFADTLFANHTHVVSDLEVTDELWDDKHSAKAKKDGKASASHNHVAVVAMSDEDQERLKVLVEISILMKDKKMSAVTRTESIADLLESVGML